jgi:hypothetical protein
LTHYLADFITPVYELIKDEILAEDIVVHADETAHRMLEGDPKASWYLWGFSTDASCYFECHDTRSGDVASEILLGAKTQFLMSDVYSGYHKAVGVCNKARQEHGLSPLENIHCNAHARRKFKELGHNESGLYFIEQYKLIYKLEKESSELAADGRQAAREELRPIFKAMLASAEEQLVQVSSKSQEAQALNYFMKNFAGLTRFLDDYRLPIDNNHQERLLRSTVVGRKTWYGTHSKRGAETAAKLFTIVESAKLNNLNPRRYLEVLVKDLHHKKIPKTPKQMVDELASDPKTG